MDKINILLCEDVRNEANGMKSLIGVFPPKGLRVEKLPFLFPKFSMFVTSDFKEKLEYTFRVYDPKDNIILKGDLPKVPDTANTVQFAIVFSPFVIKEFGKYKFTVIRNDDLEESVSFEVVQEVK